MIESSLAADRQGQRYPLSFTQEWFLTLDQGDDGGTFGPRFMIVSALRVTGHVDLAVLQGSLDAVPPRPPRRPAAAGPPPPRPPPPGGGRGPPPAVSGGAPAVPGAAGS